MKKKLNEINKNKNLEIAHLKRFNEDFKTMNEKKYRVNSLPNDIYKGVVQCETNYREFEEFYTELIEGNR